MLYVNYFVQINFETDCFSTHTVTDALNIFGCMFNTLIDALDVSTVITKLLPNNFCFGVGK